MSDPAEESDSTTTSEEIDIRNMDSDDDNDSSRRMGNRLASQTTLVEEIQRYQAKERFRFLKNQQITPPPNPYYNIFIRSPLNYRRLQYDLIPFRTPKYHELNEKICLLMEHMNFDEDNNAALVPIMEKYVKEKKEELLKVALLPEYKPREKYLAGPLGDTNFKHKKKIEPWKPSAYIRSISNYQLASDVIKDLLKPKTPPQ